jgi:hypothetical protein
MAAISVPAIILIFTGTWYGLEGFLRGPRGDLIGQIVLCAGGAFGFVLGVWYWFDKSGPVR